MDLSRLEINRRTALLTSAAIAANVINPMRAFAQETPRKGGVFNVHYGAEQRQLNPSIQASTGVYIIGGKIQENLVDLDAQGQPVGVLAESWEATPDGKTVTFKLRKGITWHDGKPFTSEDVAFTAMNMWKKILNYGSTLQLFLTSVDTPDPQTAIFRYERPMPLNLLLRALPDLGYVSAKHLYESGDIRQNPTNLAPVGTGPFKFVKYERGQYIIADRNPDYWRPNAPYLDRIVWKVITDRAAAAARATELLAQFSLADSASTLASAYSGGMRRRLDIAASLCVVPRLLFLDEPTTGLDPVSREELWGFIRQLRDDGMTLVLTTQYLEEAEALADHVHLLKDRRIVASGTPEELRRDFGSHVLRVSFATAAGAEAFARCLRGACLDRARVAGKMVSLDVDPGPQVLEAVARAMEASEALPDSLSVSPPTLNEVFISMNAGGAAR